MDVSYCLVFLTVLYGLVSAQDNEDPDGLPRALRFYEYDVESKLIASNAAQSPATVKRSTFKFDYVRKKDLSYPGCGNRSPMFEENDKPISRSKSRGRRSKSQRFHFNRPEKRDIYPTIVGGARAEENSWPWMVALLKGIKVLFFRCGASLISPKYLLTAAHCFDPEKGDIDPREFRILVGGHTVSTGTIYYIRKVFIHPDYKRGEFYHDITILEATAPIELSEKVYPVCLPPDRLIYRIEREDHKVTVTGWGHTTFNGSGSYFLQELKKPIISLQECNASYSMQKNLSAIPRGITSEFICAGFWEEGKGSCQGDSGGPLVSPMNHRADDDFTYFQVGVTSFGVKCDKLPGVYIRVSEYKKWIYDNTDLKKV